MGRSPRPVIGYRRRHRRLAGHPTCLSYQGGWRVSLMGFVPPTTPPTRFHSWLAQEARLCTAGSHPEPAEGSVEG